MIDNHSLQKTLNNGFRFLTYLGLAFFLTESFLVLFDITEFSNAKSLGTVSGLAFVLVLVPGIIKRFGLVGKPIFKNIYQILNYSRAQIGIMMYLIMYVHHLGTGYNQAGVVVLYLLLPLLITSNMFSKKLLKKWWQRLHWLVYIAFWFIILHVVQVESENLLFLLIAVAVVEVVSFGYAFWRNKKKLS
jgi:hypothetical protein